MSGNTKLWTMRDGRKIRVCDMTDAHLRNAMSLLRRGAEAECSRTVAAYLNGPRPTADMASYCFDREFDAALDATGDDYLPEIYHDMQDELERRGTVPL